MSEFNPLVQRVDALLKRHQQQGPDVTVNLAATAEAGPVAQEPAAIEPAPPLMDDDIPVLTEVFDTSSAPVPQEAHAALAGQIERDVLEKVIAELDAALEQRLGRAISDVLGQAVDGLRVDLAASVRETVREAVAGALRRDRQDR